MIEISGSRIKFCDNWEIGGNCVSHYKNSAPVIVISELRLSQTGYFLIRSTKHISLRT